MAFSISFHQDDQCQLPTIFCGFSWCFAEFSLCPGEMGNCPFFATFISNSRVFGLLFNFTIYKTIKSSRCKLTFMITMTWMSRCTWMTKSHLRFNVFVHWNLCVRHKFLWYYDIIWTNIFCRCGRLWTPCNIRLTTWSWLMEQESAAYATFSARQGRHLANTFEVAAVECLTCVAT